MPISFFSLFFFGWRRICIASVTGIWSPASQGPANGKSFSGGVIQLIIWRNFNKSFAFSVQVHLWWLPSFGIVFGPEFSTSTLYNNVLQRASCMSVYFRAISCCQIYRSAPLNLLPWTPSKSLFSNSKSPIIGEGEQTLSCTLLAN